MNTSLTRSNSPLTSAIDQFFDDAFFRRFGERAPRNGETSWFPTVDLSQTEESFLVRVDLPGMTKEDIDVTLENQTLTLSGERKFQAENEGENFSRIERSYGKFTRTFQLPTNVDSQNVSATFDNGVLTVKVPKTEEARSRRIEIS